MLAWFSETRKSFAPTEIEAQYSLNPVYLLGET